MVIPPPGVCQSQLPASVKGLQLPFCRNYDRKKPPFLFLENEKKLHRMNIHYAFSIREVSEVVDSDQTLQVKTNLSFDVAASLASL